MANVNVGQLLATTIPAFSKELSNTIKSNTPLLFALRNKGKDRMFAGGSTIRQTLVVAENSTAKSYSGLEQLNIQDQPVIDAANFDIKQMYVAVVVSGLEGIQNSGSKESMVNLVEEKIEIAGTSLQNSMNNALFSDGTGNGGKDIDGLQAMIPDNPALGTYGGIDRSLHPFWRPVVYNAVADGGAATTASNIREYFNAIWVQLTIDSKGPDLIIAGNDYFQYFLSDRQNLQRITNTKMAGANFQSIPYMGADLVLGGGYQFTPGSGQSSKRAYFLDTSAVTFKTSVGRDMQLADSKRWGVNQDAYVQMIFWAGNLTTSNSRGLGLLKE